MRFPQVLAVHRWFVCNCFHSKQYDKSEHLGIRNGRENVTLFSRPLMVTDWEVA